MSGGLRLDRVTVAYGGGRPILDDVTLAIEPGDFVVVIGPSGSGKTTLLRLAAGFLPAAAGHLTVGGEAVTGPAADRSVVFQEDALFPWLRARDNVAFALKVRGTPKDERHREADAMLRLVGLDGMGDRRIWELSGGQRQRVGIARALLAGPRFLLMDEPFGALDPLTRSRMQLALLEIWQRTAKGILFITHDIEEALLLATRLVVLSANPGRIERVLEPDFGRRLVAGEPGRALRTDPGFVALREDLLDAIFGRMAA
ncbi:MAG: ATP-binding cassette domain-containing protein [Geminicoccaceae bacterium]